MYKISVVVLVYNSTWEDLKFTLESVLEQDLKNYEIIVADDCSKQNWKCEIEKLFAHNNFRNYSIILHKKNVGTVCNLLGALEKVSGKYVKPLGAGDAFYDCNVLKRVTSYMDKYRCRVLFGKMQGYIIEGDNNISYVNFQTPLDVDVYKEYNCKRVKKNLQEYQDTIAGVAVFFEYKFLLEYLSQIKGIVKYCEDLLLVEMAENTKIYYYDSRLMLYQYTTGVSINGKERLLKDRLDYWNYLIHKYPDNKNYKRGIRIIKIDLLKNSLIRKVLKLCFCPRYFVFYIRHRKNRYK